MTAVFQPSVLRREYPLPPSKSLLHRYLFAGALADGESRIAGVSEKDLCEDVKATLRALRFFGAEVSFARDGIRVTGHGNFPVTGDVRTVDCAESATTLRLLAPSLLIGGGNVTFRMAESLAKRQTDLWESLFSEKGIDVQRSGTALTLSGAFHGGDYSLPGDLSSQFISGLLFALPKTEEGGRILLTKKPESRPYIEMTRSVLRSVGIVSKWESECVISVAGRQTFTPFHTEIEADASAGVFSDALLDFAGKTAKNRRSLVQGDSVFADVLAQMKAGQDCFDLSDTPDIAPMLFAYAGTLDHPITFRGTHRLRLKETDRIETMKAELQHFGIRLTEEENAVTLLPPKRLLTPDVPLCGHNDHRVIMALSVLLTKTGGAIEGAEAVAKSDPAFFERLKSGGISVTVTE